MFKKTFLLFKIGKKLAKSGAINSISEIYNPPILIKIFFFILGFSLKNEEQKKNESSGQKLCSSLQEMGTTFIKLGQFLATRPDIIGEKLAKDLEKLQDKLPAFSKTEASLILKKELGEKTFQNIREFSEPIAAASIAQVHFAKIKNNGVEKEIAIKILRPSIQKIFNEELDALMLLAYIIENAVKKTKRLKLIEIVYLLKEITNIEMDLRFEAAAANELYENTKSDIGFIVPKIYWNFTTQKILTLDRIEGIVSNYKRKVRSPSFEMNLPSVIALNSFIKLSEHPNFTRFNVFLRDKFTCQYCGDKNDLTFDHLLPKSKGGFTDWENVVTACSVCNVKKGGGLYFASGMKLFRKPFRPTVEDLHKNGRNFPPNFLHESWMDYLYWDVELEP